MRDACLHAQHAMNVIPGAVLCCLVGGLVLDEPIFMTSKMVDHMAIYSCALRSPERISQAAELCPAELYVWKGNHVRGMAGRASRWIAVLSNECLQEI